MSERTKTAVVTGASSGIGAATARALAAAGYHLVVGARRVERLREVTAGLDAEVYPLDVTDRASVRRFAGHFKTVDLLVNNAGAALGLDSLEGAVEERWQAMFELNVMGTLRVLRGFLTALRASGNGHVINVGSTAAIETYAGGGGYTASKHALRALTRTLRLELLGEPIRVTDITPGMVETEFSRVRFGGDTARAAQVYRGLTPLAAEDVADCIVWAATRPPHVNIDEIVVRPRDQASSTAVVRRQS